MLPPSLERKIRRTPCAYISPHSTPQYGRQGEQHHTEIAKKNGKRASILKSSSVSSRIVLPSSSLMPPLQLPSECGNERRSNGVAEELQRSCHEEAETRRYPTFSFQEKYIRCKYTKKALGNLDITTVFFLDKLLIACKRLTINIYFGEISTTEK